MAKRSPLKVLLFLILLLVVAYFCKRGWEGFYATSLPSDMPPDMGSPIRVGDYIYVHNTSPGAVSQPASFNMGVENKAWVINTPTPTEAQLKAAPQDDKTLISMFEWDWGVDYKPRGWYTYNGRTVYGRYVGANSHWWSISYIVKPPPPPPPAAARAAAACPTCPDLSAYMLSSSCNACAAPNACVDMTPYMLKAKCVLTDDDPNPRYMLIDDCECPECKGHRQS